MTLNPRICSRDWVALLHQWASKEKAGAQFPGEAASETLQTLEVIINPSYVYTLTFCH